MHCALQNGVKSMDNKDNSVLFKGVKDGIIILLDKEVEFHIIKEQLNKKILDAQKFFGGAKCSIFLDGRELSDEEEKELTNIITNKINLDVENIKRLEKVENGKEVQKEVIFENGFGENNTKFYKGTLRSGQKIEYNGSIVILGDVNPGSEVVATGNIIVLGTLKGIVHAGCGGKNAFVAALKMIPVQLRIADIIGRAPDKNDRKIETAELAYIDDNTIYIEPIDAKLLVNL